MKSISIIRRLDGFGRIVLPGAFRVQLGIEEGTEIEIYSNGDAIVLEKYVRGCMFCGITEGTMAYRGQPICRNCIAEMPVCCSEERRRGCVG
jgi:transcriptional pleiotropic regulator of transition state genes